MQTEKFDVLLSLAAKMSVADEADAFLATDTTAVSMTPKFERRVLRHIRGNSKRPRKIVVAAILAAALLALSACACIPEVREYFWRAFTTDQGDYLQVEFETVLATEGEATEETTEQQSLSPDTETAQTDPAESFDFTSMIAQFATLTYVPDGCVMGEENVMLGQYHVTYNTEDGEFRFTVSQSIEKSNDVYVDNDPDMQIVHVHQNEAILLQEPYEQEVFAYLVWRDGEYIFSITGFFASVEQLMQVAESITY